MDENFAEADQDHVDRLFDDIQEAAKKPGFFDEERPKSAGRWNDPGYWEARIKGSAFHNRGGYRMEWLIVSAYNWRRIVASFLPFLPPDLWSKPTYQEPPRLFGLCVSVVPCEADILEVR